MPETSAIRSTTGQKRLYDSVLENVGNTPCIRINNLAPHGVTIYVIPTAELSDPCPFSICD